MESSMDKVFIDNLMAKNAKDSGRMAKESNGWMKLNEIVNNK
jgi:hypothetical protein